MDQIIVQSGLLTNDLNTCVGKVECVADEKDLESDEALWALYERWCKAFNQERSLEEMARRFSKFKQTVLMLDSNKKARLPYRLEINWFADGKDIELVRPKVPNSMGRADSGTFRAAAGDLKKDPEGPG